MTFMALPPAPPGARGRHRAAGRPRFQRAALVVKLCALAALVAGAVAGVAARHPAQAAAVNLLANPSFEQGVAPWGGSHISRQTVTSAPDGRWVAQVSAVSGRAAIDDWPGEVRSQSGTGYDGRMSLAASSASSVG